jgi:hypothetical protein
MKGLVSQSTLCRFENATDSKDLRRLAETLMDLYLETHQGPRDLTVIDVDSMDDPTHGRQ